MDDTMKFDFKTAKELYRKEEYEEAFRLFEKLANKDHQESQYYLARMYRYGLGTEVDYEKAFEWSSEATSQDERKASWQLMDMYEKGIGCPVNKEKAEELYWNLVDTGRVVPRARQKLGIAESKFENQQYEEAFSLFRELAERGVPEAQSYLSIMYASGLGVKPDQRESERWYELFLDEEGDFKREYSSRGSLIIHRGRHW